MPSLFTSNGGIELPADGEQDGVWGDTVNANMQIIDRLTNGVGAVSLAGTTHTLTTLNGALSDGQYSLIVFGGSPSGTNTVTIAPNDAEKTYLVRNATAYDVVLTQGSGGDVTVPAGAGAIVYANGAGTGAAVADLTATFIPDLALAGVTASTAELNILDGATLSTAELNLLDGVTADTAELNILDGVTADTAELNILDGVTADTAELNILDGVTATTAELNILTGVTATTAELNLLDGVTLVLADVTATAAELNILDGVTASTAELNLLDGVTATTEEINYLSGVTSTIQTQLNAKAPDNELTQLEVEDDTSTVFGQVSGERLAQAVVANETQWSESAEQTMTAGSTNTFAHGLAAAPSMWQVFIRCKTANVGFSVGDELPIYPNNSTSGETSVSKMWADVSNIYFNLDSDGRLLPDLPTLSNWRVFIRWQA
jgi:hypothetical protein